MKVYFLQRLSAYFVDSIIIFLISALIGIFIPVSNAYNNALEKNRILSDSYLNEEISEEEYIKEYGKLTYIVEKERAVYNVVSIIVTIAYFGAYPYYMNGQTIGKKRRKIAVVGENYHNPSYLTFVLRSAFIHGSIFSAINLLLLLFCDASNYFNLVSIVNSIYSIIFIVTVFMIIYRKDGRGLHDIIFKTKVVNN